MRARPSVLCLNEGFVLLPVGLAVFYIELCILVSLGYVYHLGSLVKQMPSRFKQLEDTPS